jgi:Ser/Thr protein kinase RdoA (MazF antagonist)
VPESLEELTARGLDAAVACARRLGIRCDRPLLLAGLANAVVWLRPAPVVARVATLLGSARAQGGREQLAREVEIARFLDAAGIPVLRPISEADPGPHQEDGLWLTLWEHVQLEPGSAAPVDEVASLLRELHGALEGFDGSELPFLGPALEDVPRVLDTVEARGGVRLEDLAFMRASLERIAAELAGLDHPRRPLHGDPHAENLLRSGSGLRWTDFEDACLGPVHWDLVCLSASSTEASKAALAAYGGDIAPEELDPFIDARVLEGAAWTALLASVGAAEGERVPTRMSWLRDRMA